VLLKLIVDDVPCMQVLISNKFIYLFFIHVYNVIIHVVVVDMSAAAVRRRAEKFERAP
jgi:hypothetical protein